MFDKHDGYDQRIQFEGEDYPVTMIKNHLLTKKKYDSNP